MNEKQVNDTSTIISDLITRFLDNREKRKSKKITTGMRISAMLAIVAIACTAFHLVQDDRAAVLVYFLIGGGGIGAIASCIFCGHE